MWFGEGSVVLAGVDNILGVVVVFSSKYDVAPINFVSPSTLTKDCVQAMLDLDLTR